MDFQVLINELIDKGWTQAAIARESGCAQSNIARLLSLEGAEPKYSTGANLVNMNRYKDKRAYLRSKK